ncbi:hypothetical protein [Allosalinactinospora lopnorensis]|uniref:hypothetical protein n=1 Tax=Allosalinactinospora lopnorensis TaxID=1352348 RepID=UPI000623DD2B|nr:hypothetical protein [Allosalinactinospora lopnorensis]
MRQIDKWYGQPEIAELEDRVRRLEAQVVTLSRKIEELRARLAEAGMPPTLGEQPPDTATTEPGSAP